MTGLPDGADLSLTASGTTYDFQLERSVQDYYKRYTKDLNAQAYTIAGTPGLQNLDPTISFWDMDDWSGGEGEGTPGSILWRPDDPTVYDYFNGNPRMPGQFTGAPTITTSNVKATLTGTLGLKAFLARAAGKLWFGCNDGDTAPAHLSYTSDLVTWTSVDPVGAADGSADGVPTSAAFFITGMVGKGDYVYVSLSESINMNPGAMHLRRISTSTNELFVEAPSAHDTKGMGELRQYIYRWTGQILSQYDSTADRPTEGTQVYLLGPDVAPATVIADVTATDNSIYLMVAQEGITHLHEYTNVGNPVWTAPEGFTGRALGYSLGSVFVAGTYTDGSAIMFQILLGQNSSREVGFFRRGTTLTPAAVSAGMGTQVLVGMAEGSIYIYDMNRDSISLLSDTIVTQTAGDTLLDVGTYLNKRVAAVRNNASNKYQAATFAEDTTIPITTSATLYSGEWDLDLAMEPQKVLHGVHITSSALSATATVQVYYAVDDGSYVSCGTANSGTSNYLAVSTSSSTIRGNRYKFKTVITSTSGSACPVVKRIVGRFENWNYREQWDLALHIGTSQGQRGQGNDPEPSKIRAWLRTLMTNRTLVDFVDGTLTARQESSATATTATCIIKSIEDHLTDKSGRGYAMVTLANVSPSS